MRRIAEPKTSRSRVSRTRVWYAVAVPCAVFLASANPPEDAVRAGADAYHRGDFDSADRWFAAAEADTLDPGLVAFNRGAVAFTQGRFREAELYYLRTLGDAAIPPERRSRALYDRGACLLKQAPDADALRTAIACFEACRDSEPTDAGLLADCRHNLEVAKLLWNQARDQKPTPTPPGDPPPEAPEPTKPRGPDPQADPGSDRPGGPGSPKPEPKSVAGPAPKPGDARPTDRTAPGAGRLPVLADRDAPQPLTPADTRELLARVAERLAKDRAASAKRLAPPDRPGVPDW